MPIVNGKHLPYTKENIAKYVKTKKKGKSYSKEHVKMARKMMEK